MSANSQSTDELFDTLDATADGKVHAKDLITVLKHSGLYTEETAPEFMHAMGFEDDQNGEITREEFSTWVEAAREILYPVYTTSPDAPLQPCEVFLGGSCNPTTWRQDLVIPYLEARGVTYYNPQVEEWNQSLVALENKAKQDAMVLLFVIDKSTRALSSMVEVAELVSKGRSVVLVCQDVEPGHTIGGEVVGPLELKDLNRCRAYLADIVARNATGENCIVYRNIVQAARCVVRIVNSLREQACSEGDMRTSGELELAASASKTAVCSTLAKEITTT